MEDSCGLVIGWRERGWTRLLPRLHRLLDKIVIVGDSSMKREAVETGWYWRSRIVFVEETRRRGKPFAVSLGLRVAWFLGCRLLLVTDADVLGLDVDAAGLERVRGLLADPGVAGASGRVSYTSTSGLGAAWAVAAEDFFHAQRLAVDPGGRVFLSGYLMFLDLAKLCSAGCPWIPGDVVDDVYLTLLLWRRGYRTRYAPWTRVRVLYPASIGDLARQKRRNIVGTRRAEKRLGIRLRDYVGEVAGYLRSRGLRVLPPRAAAGFAAAALAAWVAAKIDLLLGRGATELWGRVESTKTCRDETCSS